MVRYLVWVERIEPVDASEEQFPAGTLEISGRVKLPRLKPPVYVVVADVSGFRVEAGKSVGGA